MPTLLRSGALTKAKTIAESLRLAISDIAVSREGKECRVTISLGITVLRAGDTDIADVIARADAASYRDKSSGRNRIEVG